MKDYLKVGYIVELEDGENKIIMPDTEEETNLVLVSRTGGYSIRDYLSNSNILNKIKKIKKLKGTDNYYSFFSNKLKDHNTETVWEDKCSREPTAEERLDQLEELTTPIVEYINTQFDPYTKVIVSYDGAIVSQDMLSTPIKQFID